MKGACSAAPQETARCRTNRAAADCDRVITDAKEQCPRRLPVPSVLSSPRNIRKVIEQC